MTPDSIPDTAKGATPQPLGVGLVLRETRESMGLSLEDVANRLKFAPNQIAALEAEDFAHLPEIAFVRGFVRSYARLLQLDEASLLAKLPNPRLQETVAAQEKQTSVEEPFPNLYALRKENIIWLAGALVVALVIGLFTWAMSSKQPEPKHEESSVAVAEPASAVVEALPVSAVPVTETEVRPETKPEPKTKAETKPEAKNKGKPKKNTEAIAASAVASTASAAAHTASAVGGTAHKASSRATLRFVFDEDSWVEVKDQNGTILLSQMGTSGNERIINRAPPFTISIGHAHGVRVFFKGQQVDLAPYTRVDVAHLTLE